MSRAQELLNAARAVADGLSGDDGLLGRIAPLVREGRELEQLDPSSKALVDRLAALSFEVEDLGREFESLGGDFSFEPEQVEALTQRMNTWLDAKRKHGGSVAAVLAAAEECGGGSRCRATSPVQWRGWRRRARRRRRRRWRSRVTCAPAARRRHASWRRPR
jgi:DNA repair ATPase RecN